jgi:hypothetical protein
VPAPATICCACAGHHLLCPRWHPMSWPRRPHYATPVSDAAHAPALTSCHARLDVVPTPLPVLRDTKQPGIIRRVPRRWSSVPLSLSLFSSLIYPFLIYSFLSPPARMQGNTRQKGQAPRPGFWGFRRPPGGQMRRPARLERQGGCPINLGQGDADSQSFLVSGRLGDAF